MGRFDGGLRDSLDDDEARRRPKNEGRLGKSKKPHERQESRVAKTLGGRQQKGSGNQPWAKGDVEIPESETLVAECKTTDKRHLLIEMSWLRKITREARAVRKTPVLVFGFEGMTRPTPKDWAAVPLDTLERLIQAAGWDVEGLDG